MGRERSHKERDVVYKVKTVKGRIEGRRRGCGRGVEGHKEVH